MLAINQLDSTIRNHEVALLGFECGSCHSRLKLLPKKSLTLRCANKGEDVSGRVSVSDFLDLYIIMNVVQRDLLRQFSSLPEGPPQMTRDRELLLAWMTS
jgi:hypothetical protein